MMVLDVLCYADGIRMPQQSSDVALSRKVMHIEIQIQVLPDMIDVGDVEPFGSSVSNIDDADVSMDNVNIFITQ
jgi:hypothetical protein